MAPPPTRIDRVPRFRAQPPPEIQAQLMMAEMKSSGGLTWKVVLPGFIVVLLLSVFLWRVLDPDYLRDLVTTTSHRIELQKFSKKNSAPFRVLSIEGERFHHPPVGHGDLYRGFDKSANERVIAKVRRENREQYESETGSSFQWDEDWDEDSEDDE